MYRTSILLMQLIIISSSTLWNIGRTTFFIKKTKYKICRSNRQHLTSADFHIIQSSYNHKTCFIHLGLVNTINNVLYRALDLQVYRVCYCLLLLLFGTLHTMQNLWENVPCQIYGIEQVVFCQYWYNWI